MYDRLAFRDGIKIEISTIKTRFCATQNRALGIIAVFVWISIIMEVEKLLFALDIGWGLSRLHS